MNPSKSSETDRLRDVDLMIAYLNDQASLAEVVEVEALMEEDPLYRLSMERLAVSLAEDATGTPERVRQTEAAMPDLLRQAQAQFTAQLAAEKPSKSWIDRIPLWQKYLALSIGLLVLLLLSWLLLRQTPPPTDPNQFLTPSEDVTLAEQFFQRCGDADPGIGRPAQASLQSALMRHFAEGNYQQAAQEFAQLRQQGAMEPCQGWLHFYQGESYLGLQAWEEAQAQFMAALEESIPPALQHACHWYLGNLALRANAYELARQHFAALPLDASGNSNDHLKTLIEKQYLSIAKRYMKYLSE